MTKIDAPKHLSKASAAWFLEVAETFELAGDQARVLQLAAEAWDLAQAARAEIAEEGITIRSATGAAKAHPAVATLNSAWDRFLKAVAMLGLNADELPGKLDGDPLCYAWRKYGAPPGWEGAPPAPASLQEHASCPMISGEPVG